MFCAASEIWEIEGELTSLAEGLADGKSIVGSTLALGKRYKHSVRLLKLHDIRAWLSECEENRLCYEYVLFSMLLRTKISNFYNTNYVV